LFIRTGKRDIYGSVHHKNWMWHSKSTNCITVNGEGQKGHSASATGEILDFHTDAEIDYVCGEASKAYEGKLKQFTRRMLYIKPEAIVIFDTLQAPQDSTFEWGLHAINQMKIDNQHNILAENGKAACKINFLWPENLSISQTDKFDPPPRERIKLVEHHLTAATSDKSQNQTFVTVLRPYRSGQSISGAATLTLHDGVYQVKIPLSSGSATAVLTQNGVVQGKIFDQSGSEQKSFTSQR
jgi:heparinase II/III-like protein